MKTNLQSVIIIVMISWWVVANLDALVFPLIGHNTKNILKIFQIFMVLLVWQLKSIDIIKSYWWLLILEYFDELYLKISLIVCLCNYKYLLMHGTCHVMTKNILPRHKEVMWCYCWKINLWLRINFQGLCWFVRVREYITSFHL